MIDRSADYPPADTLTLWATLERLVATEGECGAEVWLQRDGGGEFYRWDTCTEPPGHDGPHRVWSSRDSDYWAEWTDTKKATSPYVGIEDTAQKLVASPWKKPELEILKALNGS